MAIAATVQLQRGRGGWHVLSQSGSGTYVVDPELGECTCADYETSGGECKHLLAVRFTIRRERGKSGAAKYEKKEQVTYSQPWAAYNAAQCEEKDRFLELLSALCKTAPEVLGRRRAGPAPRWQSRHSRPPTRCTRGSPHVDSPPTFGKCTGVVSSPTSLTSTP